MRRLEIIEFLKGYSIFTIIVFHYLQRFNFPHPYDQLIFFGGTGVHLFILLSGLGLYLSFLNNPVPYTSYIKKRSSKIYFPYAVVVALSALISLFIPIYENSLYAFGGHIFLYKMFDENIIGSYGYPLWFISTILQFYIFFYALAYIAKRLTNIQFLILSLALSIIWTVIVISIGKESERVWNSFFLRYLWEFALGMVIASMLKQNDYRVPFKRKPLFFLVVGVFNCVLYAVLAIKGGSVGKMVNDIPALIGYSSIAIWVYQLRLDIINKFFVFTGKISYALYLLHFLVLLLALFVFRHLPLAITIGVSLAATYGLAAIYEKTTARPGVPRKPRVNQERGIIRTHDAGPHH